MRTALIGFNDSHNGQSPFCIRECWEDYAYRGPFKTRIEAVERVRVIAGYEGYEVAIVHVPFNVAGESKV